MVKRAVEFVHRHGLNLALVLYMFVILVVLMCGALLKWSVS